MKTFLLAWNPNRWGWEDLHDWIDRVERGEAEKRRWSCGNSKRPKKNDRVFLICLGREPKGIFGSGTIVKGSYLDWHWEDQKANQGEKSRFIKFKFDILLNPQENIFPRERLDIPPFDKMHWSIQKSGAEIPADIAVELEKAWAEFNQTERFWIAEEVVECYKLEEGTTRRISVNIYERNAAARKKCITHYGAKCIICGFDFYKKYGTVGKGIIHVHHLVPLSEIGKKYEVDPINDLRPVCPNCHAIIHSRKPAYTVEEVQLFIKQV